MSLIGRTRRQECPEHGPPEKPGHYARCPECRGALVWVECVVVPTTTYQGAVKTLQQIAERSPLGTSSEARVIVMAHRWLQENGYHTTTGGQ